MEFIENALYFMYNFYPRTYRWFISFVKRLVNKPKLLVSGKEY